MTQHRTTPRRSSPSRIPSKFVTQLIPCQHTLHHRNPNGPLMGTWIEEHGPYGTRIVCRHCGKFYGYLPLENDRSEEQAHGDYLQQRSEHATGNSSLQN